MTRLLWAPAVLTLVCVAFASAAAPQPQVDANLATKGDLWQGQRIVIEVTIKTPDTFASAPAFDLPQTAGVILLPPSGSPVLGTEMIGDDSFTTQTHELTVFPQKEGDLTVPALSIRFDSNAGFGKPVHSRTVTTPAVSMNVKRPPGTEGVQLVLTTTSLTIKNTWKPEMSDRDVPPGTAWTRTIVAEAADLPGIVLPAFHVDLPEGLRAYNHPPQLNDQENRGDLTGRRTETTTFVCERPGSYQIPAMTLAWWNPEERKLHQETLSGHNVTVTAPPIDLKTKTTAAASSNALSPWISATVLAVGIGALCLGPRIQRRWRRHQVRVAGSEPAFFRSALSACRSGDAHAAYQAILKWREAMDPPGDERAGEYRDLSSDAELMLELAKLESNLYSPAASKAPWSPERLSSQLVRSRRSRHGQRAFAGQNGELPTMNQ